MFDMPPIPRPVPLARRRAPFLAQGPFVEIRPEIKVESPKFTIELGSLPLSLGLFMGSGLAFLLRTALPEGWPKAAALVAGGGLAAAGVVNLLLPKAEAAGAPKPPSPPSPQAPAVTSEQRPFTPATVDAFEQLTGRIVSPADFSTVDIGAMAGSYPVVVHINNPSSTPVTFTLELVAEETPRPFGSEQISSAAKKVEVPAGGILPVMIDMPIAVWSAFVFNADVVLEARKRRSPDEPAMRLDFRNFVIE